MKYLKMLGLAAVAAAALMAFAGAGTATAGELCTVNTNPCPEASKIKEVHGTLEKNAKGELTAILETTGGTVLDTCTSSTVQIKPIESNGAGSVKGPITSLTWGGAGTECTVLTKTLQNGTSSATLVENEKKEKFINLSASGTQVTTNTSLFGSCVETATAIGSIPNGGSTLTVSTTATRISGLCPETMTWTATYKITNHSAVFLVG